MSHPRPSTLSIGPIAVSVVALALAILPAVPAHAQPAQAPSVQAPPAQASPATPGQTAPGQTAPAPATAVRRFPLEETKGLIARNVTLDAVEYKGRKAVRLTMTEPTDGLALLEGSDFQDGTIEADIAVKILAPPGVRMPGFIGIAFRARPDASHFDLFYVRPGNGRADDQAMRNHAVQYSAVPGFGWYPLRRAWPSVYEAYVDLQPETWTALKIEVAGRTAALYVNGGSQPVLKVDGLKGTDLRGAIGLSGFPGEEAYFSNIRITPAAPKPVTNGSDATGSWKVRCSTDVGPMEGLLRLRREGGTLSGTWSGELGSERPVTGTWRDGYVELTFSGTWSRPTAPTWVGDGPAVATLAGWIDGDAASGRMKVEGRTDGRWSATRAPAAP